jgi:DNA-binding NarL/FixJ family response regulator
MLRLVSTAVQPERGACPDPLRVVLADDHPVYRQGLAKLLGKSGIAVVGEAANGRAAIEVVERVAPEVVVVDLYMPGVSGFEVIQHLTGRRPPMRVLVVTGSADEDDVSNAIRAGASGYLLKDGPVEEVVLGIRAAAVGGALISPSIAPRLLGPIRDGLKVQPEPPPAVLSKRELDVLKLVADGKCNQEIGEALFIGTGTVRNHVSRVLMKLNVDNRVQAAVRAVRDHMI